VSFAIVLRDMNQQLDDVRLAREVLDGCRLDMDMDFADVTWVDDVTGVGLANVQKKNRDDVRLPRGLAKSIQETQIGQADAC